MTEKKKFFDKKTVTLMLVSTLLIIVGMLVCFGLHEGSHYVTLVACNGVATEVSMGMESYVAGYIAPQHITIVALSSLLIPLVFSLATIWIKNMYFNFVALGFSVTNLINGLLGIAAFVLIDDKATKLTFDIPLAVEYAQNQTGIFLFSVLCVVFCSACVGYSGEKVKRALENYV